MYALIIAAAAMTAPAMQDNPAGNPPVQVQLEVTDSSEGAPCAYSGTLAGAPFLREEAWSNETGYARGQVSIQPADPGEYVTRVSFTCVVPVAGAERPSQETIHSIPSALVKAGDRRRILRIEQFDATRAIDVFITVTPLSE